MVSLKKEGWRTPKKLVIPGPALRRPFIIAVKVKRKHEHCNLRKTAL